MPEIAKIKCSVNLLARSESRNNRLGKEVIFKVVEVSRVS
jgi:hypothetical protein